MASVINEIRRICHELNPSAPEDIDLIESIQQTVDVINGTGKLQVSFTAQPFMKNEDLNLTTGS